MRNEPGRIWTGDLTISAPTPLASAARLARNELFIRSSGGRSERSECISRALYQAELQAHSSPFAYATGSSRKIN